MHPGEHAVMSRVEDRHWWYRGLRDAVRRSLGRPDLAPPAGGAILDAGCGTGANLRMLARFRPEHLEGFDLAEEAVALARIKAPQAAIRVGDLCRPDPLREAYDAIVSLDVLYIPGIERALSGLRALTARLRPGGTLTLNLPAYDWLYSEHDVAIHTSERYTVPRVRALLARLDLEPVILTYRLCLLFPAVVATRAPGMWRARRRPENARSDLHRLPSEATNRHLLGILVRENRRIARGGRFPWGSSVFAVARRPA